MLSPLAVTGLKKRRKAISSEQKSQKAQKTDLV